MCLFVRVATVALVATAIGLYVAQAAPESVAAPQSAAAPLIAVGAYFHRPFCPQGTHYACWYGVYGHRYCGCWPGGDRPACPEGYYYDCRYAPDGQPVCGCY